MNTPKDCYEVAAERGCTPEVAAQQMREEEWIFSGYNDCGEELWREREVFEIPQADIDQLGHQGIVDAIKFANPKADVRINDAYGITITLP